MSLDNFIRKKTYFSIGNDVHEYLVFDAAISVNHNRKATITKNEVEDGSKITDHYRVENNMITVEGFISGVPTRSLLEDPSNLASGAIASAIGGLGAVVTQVGKGIIAQDVVRNSTEKDVVALEKLQEYMDKASLLRVTTGLVVYENMMIQSIAIPRNAKTGNSLRFTMTLVEVKMVKSETIELTEDQLKGITAHSAASKSDLGEQKTAEPTEAETEKSSILFSLFN